MWDWLVHLFRDRKQFDLCYQQKHCLLQSFSATHNTLHQDHTNRENHIIPFAFCGKSSKCRKTHSLCVVLHMLQSIQLLTIYRVTAYGCTSLLSKASWSPSSQLLWGPWDRLSVRGQKLMGQERLPATTPRGAASQPASTEQKPYVFCPDPSAAGGRRVTSPHEYKSSTVFSSHFPVTFLPHGP